EIACRASQSNDALLRCASLALRGGKSLHKKVERIACLEPQLIERHPHFQYAVNGHFDSFAGRRLTTRGHQFYGRGERRRCLDGKSPAGGFRKTDTDFREFRHGSSGRRTAIDSQEKTAGIETEKELAEGTPAGHGHRPSLVGARVAPRT